MFRLTSSCWASNSTFYVNWGVHISHHLIISNVSVCMCDGFTKKKWKPNILYAAPIQRTKYTVARLKMWKPCDKITVSFSAVFSSKIVLSLPWMKYSVTICKLVIRNHREWSNKNYFMGILFTFEFIVKALLCTEIWKKKHYGAKDVRCVDTHTVVSHIHAIHFLFSIQFCILCIVMLKSVSTSIAIVLKQMHAIIQWTYKTLKIDPFSGNKKH